MKKIRAIVCILLALIPVFMGVRLSHGETEPPVTMTIEPDPECQMTGPGELTYLRFTLKIQAMILIRCIMRCFPGSCCLNPWLLRKT